jgi:hypothetical protein
MSGLMNTFFGPLSKDSCVYFLILSMIFFFFLIALLFSGIVFLMKKGKNLDSKMVFHGVIIFLNLFLAYFVNRLFYTMCSKSLV